MRKIVRSEDGLHFGFLVNGNFKECTNFGIELLFCVETNLPTGPGYIAQITRASDGTTGKCYFLQRDTKDAPTFTNALNISWMNGGGLYCQFLPREMFELMAVLDAELRSKPDYTRHLIEKAGEQEDGIVALNPKLFVNANGETIENHQYVWIPEWPGAPGPLFYRTPVTPCLIQPLTVFLQTAAKVMERNYGALLMALGAIVSMLNFKGIHRAVGHFNLPVLYGPPMTGKTLAATCTGLITGMTKNQISSRNTQAFLSELFVMSTLPFLWDDPTKETEVRQVAIDLGNAAFRGKFKEDAKVPTSGCLVTANFSLNEVEKYYSRICIIHFVKLEKVQNCGEGPDLEKKATEASAALPLLLRIAKGLIRKAIEETVQLLRLEYPETPDLRILEGVAVPYLMASKVKSMLHVSGTKVYCRVKELEEVTSVELGPELKRRKVPLYKHSCRFNDKKPKKCALLTREQVTAKEWQLIEGLVNAHRQPVDPENEVEVIQPIAETIPARIEVHSEHMSETDPNAGTQETTPEMDKTTEMLHAIFDENQEVNTDRPSPLATPDQSQPIVCTSPEHVQIALPAKKPVKLNKRKIYSVRVTDQDSKPSTSKRRKANKENKEPVLFLHKNIAHTWHVDGTSRVYHGTVMSIIKGTDGGKKTVYEVKYNDGDTEYLDLYKDYTDGSLKLLN